jgi:hypothetical protein
MISDLQREAELRIRNIERLIVWRRRYDAYIKSLKKKVKL